MRTESPMESSMHITTFIVHCNCKNPFLSKFSAIAFVNNHHCDSYIIVPISAVTTFPWGHLWPTMTSQMVAISLIFIVAIVVVDDVGVAVVVVVVIIIIIVYSYSVAAESLNKNGFYSVGANPPPAWSSRET